MYDSTHNAPSTGAWAFYALAAGSLGTLLGSRISVPWLWPLIATALIYPLFLAGVRRARLGRTVALMLLWALSSSVTMLLEVRVRGLELGDHVVNGPAYAAEMMHWVRTGVGAEGSPSLFLPIHAQHYGAFVVGSFLTAGFVGLYFGTILLDYMNFYVATLAASADTPAVAYAMGWPIWAIVRVVGFVAGGTALANLVVARVLKKGEWRPALFRRWMIVSLVLVVLDVVLKATLAETWRGVLLRAFE